MITDMELVKLSAITIWDLEKMMAGKSIHQAMCARKQIQMALASYARRHKYDKVQGNILGIESKIYKWCRQRFVAENMPRLMMSDPATIRNQKAVKKELNSRWESLCRTRDWRY